MQLSNCLERETRLAAERNIRCWGTARVSISALDFPDEEDEENVDKLVELFKVDFRGLNPRYHIPAKVDRRCLDAALEFSGLTAEQLKACPDPQRGYPELKFPTGIRLKCCRGLHRAKAATKVLPPGARCWSVDLYDSNTNPELGVELSEEYSAERIPDDGVMYYKVRQYQGYYGTADPFLENRWWALIAYYSNKKRDNLKNILDDPAYRAAFDVQMDIPALGDGMEIGVFHKMKTMGCHDLFQNYLGLIVQVWKMDICQGKLDWMQKLDRPTVRAVQATAPGACERDRDNLYQKLRSGEIFGAFGEEERQCIWRGVLSASSRRLIPSFLTFFEDVNYLEGPLESLKRLIPPSRKETISSALLKAYKDVNQEPDQCMIQEPDSGIALVPGTEADRVEMGIRQAWIIAMRNSTDVPPLRKKKENVRRANPTYKESARAVYELASLLHQIGFESVQILDTIQDSADSVIAHNALLEARPPDRFAYNGPNVNILQGQIVGLFMTATELPTADVIRTAELDNIVVSPTRYGKPSETERKQTKPMLFADKLHSQEVFGEVTPFFVRRSVYLAFLGIPKFDHVNTISRRRLRLDRRQTLSSSSALLTEVQLQERERLLEEGWQKLKSEQIILLQRFQQQLADEKERLAKEINEKGAENYEKQRAALTETMRLEFDKQMKEETAKMQRRVEQYQAKKIKDMFDEKLRQIEELKNQVRQLEEGNKRFEETATQNDKEKRQDEENNKNLKERLQQVEAEKKQLEGQLEGKIQELKEEKKMHQQIVERQSSELLGENRNLKERLQQLETEKEAAGKMSFKAVEESNQRRQQLELEMTTLKIQIDAERSLHAEQGKELEEAKSQLKVKSIQLEEKDRQLEEKALKLQEIEKQLKMQETKLDERSTQMATQQETDERQLRERTAQLAEDKQALAQERNDLNDKTQDLLRERVELKNAREQLLQERQILQAEVSAKNHNLSLPPPDEERSQDRKSRDDDSDSVKRSTRIDDNYRAKLMSIKQRLGQQADEAREKRQRVDEGAKDKAKRGHETGTNEEDQLKVKAQELYEQWKAYKNEKKATGLQPQGLGQKSKRWRPATQIKVQDVVAAKPSKATEVTELPKPDAPITSKFESVKPDVPITFIFEDGVGTREETVTAAEVEKKAVQLKKDGMDIYDKNGFILAPKTCYEDVVGDGTRAIVVRLGSKMAAEGKSRARKRQAEEIE